MRKWLRLVGVAVVVGLALMLVGATVYAQGDDGDDDSQPPCGFFGGGHMHMMWGWAEGMPESCEEFMGQLAANNPLVTAAAEALGLEPDALLTELRSGKTVAQVAEEQGVALETVEAAVTAAHAERLAAAVEAGELTQEQADALQENLSEHINAFLTGEYSFPLGGRWGFGEFFGGMMGRHFSGGSGGRGPMTGRGGMMGRGV
jgi:hypothetical protein